MNFVKIRAISPAMSLNLFIKEKECYNALKYIRDQHLTGPHGNALEVTMRRVIIQDRKARDLREQLAKLSLLPTQETKDCS